MRRLAFVVLLLVCGPAVAQLYQFEGRCVNQTNLATLMCRSAYPLAVQLGLLQCVATNGPQMRLVTTDTALGTSTGDTWITAQAPQCAIGARETTIGDAVRWGNAAHVLQGVLAVMLAGMFFHGYLAGQRE